MRRARLLSLTLSALFLFSPLTGCGIVSSLISGESETENENTAGSYTDPITESDTEPALFKFVGGSRGKEGKRHLGRQLVFRNYRWCP